MTQPRPTPNNDNCQTCVASNLQLYIFLSIGVFPLRALLTLNPLDLPPTGSIPPRCTTNTTPSARQPARQAASPELRKQASPKVTATEMVSQHVKNVKRQARLPPHARKPVEGACGRAAWRSSADSLFGHILWILDNGMIIIKHRHNDKSE